jgi:outer membrane protein assembly factor BamB
MRFIQVFYNFVKDRVLLLGALVASILVLPSVFVTAGDWPMWGNTHSRNMADTSDAGIPETFDSGEFLGNSEEIDPDTTRGVRWVAKLGSQAYGNPTIAGGKVLVGTNNEAPRDPAHVGDRGVLMAFDEKSGEFLWQLLVPKLGAGKVSDWEYVGLCTSPAVVGDRAYLVSNRGEVLALDLNGMGDGNDGPFVDEGKFMAASGKQPVEVTNMHADIIWSFDMRDELGVFPHNVSSCSPLVVGNRVYVTTSNGVDWSHTNIPAPYSPAFVVLDRETGELLGEEISGISKRALHASWSSPSFGEADGTGMVILGGADGWCYGYLPEPVAGEDSFDVLSELWRFDCNPAEYRFKDGKPVRYATANGPSEIIATPVYYKNRAYVAIGQDPEHGDGKGILNCIDVTRRGDITSDGVVWSYRNIGRSISTVSISDGLLFIAEYAGNIHCLDAETGEPYWIHSTNSRIWGSTLVADEKVFIGTEDGEVVILKAGKKLELLNTVDMGAPIYSSAVAANGTLYIASQTHLYAIDGVVR